MTGWRQAVFLRQRRIELIQRALSNVLDEETWSPATPRRLHIGVADASSRGWTMIVPVLANFFVDRGAGHELGRSGAPAPRLCRLVRELRCPAYMVDVRHAAATLFEFDPSGRLQISGSPASARLCGLGDAGGEPEHAVASTAVRFGLLPTPDDVRDRLAQLHGGPPGPLADCLGALAGFPAWTHLVDHAVGARELVYEPQAYPRDLPIALTPQLVAQLTRRPPGRAAVTRSALRGVPAAQDRRGTRPRSAGRPRR